MIKQKIRIVLFALMTCLLWGCAREDSDINAEAQTSKQKQEQEYSYQQGTQKISMGDAVEDAVAVLGENYEYFEAASCAVDGMDMFYYYQNVTLVANEIDGKAIVTGLWLLNDAVATPENIRINSTYEDVLAAYGSDYLLQGTVMIYSGKNVELSIGISDGKVVTIEYAYKM